MCKYIYIYIYIYIFKNHVFLLYPVYICVTLEFYFLTLQRLHDSGKQIIKAIKILLYLQELEISAFKINYYLQFLICRQCYRYSIKLLECAIWNHNKRHFCQKCILICEAIRTIYWTSVKILKQQSFSRFPPL